MAITIEFVKGRIDQKEYKSSLSDLDMFIKYENIHPWTNQDKGRLRYLKAKCYYGLGSFEQAIYFLEKALKIDPTSNETLDLMIEVLDRIIEEGSPSEEIYKKNIKYLKLKNELSSLVSSDQSVNPELVALPFAIQSGNTWDLVGPNAKLHLVNVGIKDYQDPSIRNLKYAEKDAKAVEYRFKELFGNKVEVSNLIGSQATKENIIKTIESLQSKVSDDDIVIFYYSGHGLPPGETKLDILTNYLNTKVNLDQALVYNDNPEIVNKNIGSKTHRFSFNNYYQDKRFSKDLGLWGTGILPYDVNSKLINQTSIYTQELYKQFDKLSSKHILFIIDACYSGTIPIKDIKWFNNSSINDLGIYGDIFEDLDIHGDLRPGSITVKNNYKKLRTFQDNHIFNRISINSSSWNERSFESSKLKHSLFTYYFTKSLKDLSKIDLNNNKIISFEELLINIQNGINTYGEKYDLAPQHININNW